MVMGEGEKERNTPARTNCSIGKHVQILMGALYGAVITSCQSKAYFSSGSFVAKLQRK